MGGHCPTSKLVLLKKETSFALFRNYNISQLSDFCQIYQLTVRGSSLCPRIDLCLSRPWLRLGQHSLAGHPTPVSPV